MNRMILILFLLFAASSWAEDMVAVRNVTLIDATGTPPMAGMTVIFGNGIIQEIGKSEDTKIPEGARIVDGNGKYLIPGLWDMHIHLALYNDPQWTRGITLPLLAANGISGVRDTGGDLDAIQGIRRDVAAGKVPGLEIVTPGPMLDGPGDEFPAIVRLETEAAARAAVDSLSEQKVDFIKVLSSLPRGVYFAVAQESRKRGLPLAGHISQSITAAEASDAGQICIEHLDGVLLGSSSREGDLRKQITEALQKEDFGAFAGIRTAMLETYDEGKAQALFAKFVKNGTWQAPTFTFLRTQASLPEAERSAGDTLKYIPERIRDQWRAIAEKRPMSDADREIGARRYRKNLELVAAMKKAGVGLLAGTDTDGDTPFLVPGFSLHEELENLVRAGLTPMESLQSATLQAARFLHMEKTHGTLQKGFAANAVLLDANPLSDISNSRRISAVILRGKLLSRTDLDGLLASAQAGAAGE